MTEFNVLTELRNVHVIKKVQDLDPWFNAHKF